jgi:hypothetical protein
MLVRDRVLNEPNKNWGPWEKFGASFPELHGSTVLFRPTVHNFGLREGRKITFQFMANIKCGSAVLGRNSTVHIISQPFQRFYPRPLPLFRLLVRDYDTYSGAAPSWV